MKERFCCGQPLKSNKKIVPAVSAPLHLILRTPSPASHQFEWKNLPAVKRICQVCHLVVDGQGLRCKSCGLRVHPQCGSSYPQNSSSEPGPSLSLKTKGGRVPKRDGNFNQDRELEGSVSSGGKAQLQPREYSLFYKHFEPRIKKILHTRPLLPSIDSQSEERHSGASSSARLSCGDSVACSTAIVVGTVSIETPRSESKTPEITITPGSEVTAVEVGTEIEARLLSSSASELQADSGCGGLLDEEDESKSNSKSNSPRVGSESTTTAVDGHHQKYQAHRRVVVKVGPGSGDSVISSSENQVIVHHHPSLQKPTLLYVDGPIDGSPYAVLVKSPSSGKQKDLADSGFSVGADQMKDLDRLISALVEEAESIDTITRSGGGSRGVIGNGGDNAYTIGANKDVPYHARQDSLPFSYTSPQSITSATDSRKFQSLKQPSSASDVVDGGSGRAVQYAVTSPSPIYATPTQQHSSRDVTGKGSTSSDYNYLLDRQIITPEPSSSSAFAGLSRSISHQHQPTYYSKGPSSPFTPTPMQTIGGGPALPSNSFTYGNGNGVRRNRSQSADGRRDFDENADEWLARQMKRLQEKKASKHVVRNDWLAELKRALPQGVQQLKSTTRSQSQMGSSEVFTQEHHHHPMHQQHQPSQFSRVELPSPAVSSASYSQTPAASTSASARGNMMTSSDDDEDDVDMDMFQRGRRIQRHFSESTFDRGGYTSSSQASRAPSQASYTEMPGSFPTCPPTPYSWIANRPVSPPGKPPRSPKAIRRYQGASSAPMPIGVVDVVTSRVERAQTPVNPRPVFMGDSDVKFAQDLSEYWYKPYAAREETVASLIVAPPGSFIIRNSNSFPGAYGLAIKVSDTNVDKGIRHFLIEPTRFGVRLRGCGTLEPVFGSLSALVYAHSIECLALPTTLNLPSYEILPSSQTQSTTAQLLRQGAACQLLFLGMVGVECLSGEEAISKGVSEISAASPVPISLRLSRSGLTLTDVFRKQFFRIHFALHDILYAGVVSGRSVNYGREVKQVFGIVSTSRRAAENTVILLAEFEAGQPANAIVSFIQRVLQWQQH